jgi:four helix bundle protein
MNPPKYDWEERQREFSVRVIRVTESMNKSRAANHVADQLLRSGTSPYGNHGEAEGAESRGDFLHKIKICSKEPPETRRWLRLIQRANFVAKPQLRGPLIDEAEQLVKIFVSSIRTAERNREKPSLER